MRSRPQFTDLRLNAVKKMVEGSNPGEVANAARGWKKVHNSLVGEDGAGGIKKEFDDAVAKVLEHWHGASADQFAASAKKISQQFANLGPYPEHAGKVLDQISDRLSKVKELVEGVEEPSWLEEKADRARDFANSGTGKATVLGGGIGFVGAKAFGASDGRDDSGLNADLKNPNMSIYDAMDKNRGNLSIDRERELEAAHYMEQLATVYRAGAKSLAPRTGIDDPENPVPRHDPHDTGMMPPIGPFGPTPSSPKAPGGVGKIPDMKGGGYSTPPGMDAPRTPGIDGGIGSMPKAPSGPPVHTGLEGLGGGGGLHGGGGGLGPGGGGGGLGVGGGGGSLGTGGGSGGSNIGGPGMPGMPGGGGGRMGGTTGGARAGGAARAGGRPGMPGMGGAAGGAKGGAKGAGAGRGGPLARQKGGVVGKAGKTGAGAQGGSGLHRSRGGTQKGAAGGRRPAGMAGAPGAHGGKDKGKGENGQRPDYLVEDEETWTPERNVAPKVIE
ncbi:hypothetical protein [Streptomyces chattanoogensis]|uniref:hypothetical protein n=1 Tax=Streptomyces chattanoogensis TaxID=66876 RepID=UPI000AB8698F|nr:hypothetical protein [Streptomyces chattanoogensis]